MDEQQYNRRKQLAYESKQRSMEKRMNRQKSLRVGYDLIDKSYNYKEGVIKINIINSIAHEICKCITCYNLKKENKCFYTELIFKNNAGRADIYLPKELKVIEILHTETENKLESKKIKYPPEVEILYFHTKDILKNNPIIGLAKPKSI